MLILTTPVKQPVVTRTVSPSNPPRIPATVWIVDTSPTSSTTAVVAASTKAGVVES